MKVNVLYFGELRENVGCASETVRLERPEATVAQLIDTLIDRGEPWHSALASPDPLRVAVDQSMATKDTRLSDGGEVAFFRPVTGG